MGRRRRPWCDRPAVSGNWHLHADQAALRMILLSLAMLAAGGIFAYALALATWFCFRQFLAAWHPNNWLIRVMPDGRLIVQFRSFQLAAAPEEGPTIAVIEPVEIATVRVFTETHVKTGQKRGETGTSTSVYLELGVK